MTVTDTRRRTDADRAAEAAERRDAYLKGLRALEALIGTHADVPVPNAGTCYFALGSDEAIITEVDRIAVVLEVRPQWRGGHYVAERLLGGGVIYQAIAIPSAAARDTA